MKFIIGKKLGMTQVFREDGTVVPVTRVQAGPCVVTHVKNDQGGPAVQLGFGVQKVFRLTNPEKGHLQDIHVNNNTHLTVSHVHEFKNTNELKRGDVFGVDIFEQGEKVQVTGTSKGKGFQGVVKRHGFAGGPATHGHKDNLRMPGSIGAGGVQRVFKGMRMGGHMGDARVTVKNLEILKVDPLHNELLVKGAIPGARNGIVYIYTAAGTIAIKIIEPYAVEEVNHVGQSDQATEVESVVEVGVENSAHEEVILEAVATETPVAGQESLTEKMKTT
ncbi:MAG: 50S ribosomal protein L3 [Candidatus Magasanikbacteria bacterium]|nr:50S ribosomal protein L3 [Candidatus Magasanikbacteria bacterium]